MSFARAGAREVGCVDSEPLAGIGASRGPSLGLPGVPISELVFGTLTQNRSSLERSLGFAAIAGALWIVRTIRVQTREERKRDPKRLWRIRLDVNVVPVKLPCLSINFFQLGLPG